MSIAWVMMPVAFAVQVKSNEEINDLRRQLFWGLDVTVSGFARIEGTTEHHFDLGATPGAANSFYDMRGWLSSRIAKGPAALYLDLNYAGNDFSDPEGGIFGNAFDATSVPGGPSVVRTRGFDLSIRHLYLSYDGFVKASAGRMPAKIGHGIAIHTIRDSAKVSKRFGSVNITGVLVKGGETQPNNNLNVATDNDLDAYGGVAVYHLNRKSRVQFAVMKQVDSTFDDRFPEKLLFDFNGDLDFASWSYAFEAAYLAGQTPRDPVFGRRRHRAWMGYAKGQYNFDAPHMYISLSIGEGSGENHKSAKQHDFQSFFMNSIGFHLANIYGNDIHSYDAFLPGSGPGRDGNNAGSGFANTGFVQVAVGIAPLGNFHPSLSLEGVFTYLRATRRQLVGDGVLLSNVDGFSAVAGTLVTSNDIGWELDLNVRDQFSELMAAYFRFGWFRPGLIFGNMRRDTVKLQGGVDYAF